MVLASNVGGRRMKILLALLLATALVLSGCAQKKDDDDGAAASSSTSSSQSMTGTGGSVGGNLSTNQPPSATLTANSTGGLNVTFALNATDNDGDALTWSLDFGDNATQNGTFPARLGNASKPFAHAANVTHLYDAGGAFNVTLTLSDGKATTNVSLALNVTAGSSFEQFVAEGTPDLPCTQCTEGGANTGIGYRAGINELDSYFVELPAGAGGQPFTVTSSAGDPEVSFRDSCSGGAAVGDPFNNEGPESGVVPDGAACALMWEYSDPGSTITLTIG